MGWVGLDPASGGIGWVRLWRVGPYPSVSGYNVSDVTSRRQLRSAATSQLIIPAITRCSTLGDRAVPVAAARSMEHSSALSVICTVTSYFWTTFKDIYLFHRSFICSFVFLNVIVQCPWGGVLRDCVTLTCHMMMMITHEDVHATSTQQEYKPRKPSY